MIDFNTAGCITIEEADYSVYSAIIDPFLTEGEEIAAAYRAKRNGVVFTNKRIITVDVLDVYGKKRDISLLPYKKISAFSLETAGTLEDNCELTICFEDMGKIKFHLECGKVAANICKMISEVIL